MSLRLLAVLSLVLIVRLAVSGTAGGKNAAPYRTDLTGWRAADGSFGGWALTGTALDPDGRLQLGPSGLMTGSDPPGA